MTKNIKFKLTDVEICARGLEFIESLEVEEGLRDSNVGGRPYIPNKKMSASLLHSKQQYLYGILARELGGFMKYDNISIQPCPVCQPYTSLSKKEENND